jgi:pimeloyl-ACP methyl ester carboxylesterase
MARMSGLNEREAIEDGGAFIAKSPLAAKESELTRRYVESEIALAKAITLDKKGDPLAAVYFIRSGEVSFETMLSAECAQSVNLLCDNFKFYYLRAALGLLDIFAKENWETQNINIPTLPSGKKYSLSLVHDSKYESPSSYESIVPSITIGLEGLANRHTRYGFGLALVACRDKTEARADHYLPDVGLCMPLTAVMKYQPEANGTTAVTLEFHNALKTETVTVAGQKVELTAGFSAPFASMVERTGIGDFDGLLGALGGSDDFLEKTGFYTMEPYDESKIPLITVHGLFSNPLTWASLHNDLVGDPFIRKHFQIWHYEYSTNLPILANAKTFREKLDELSAYLQTRSKSARPQAGMVVIAHSMGGILTRTAVADNGSAFKDYFFEKDKLKELPTTFAEELSNYLTLEHKPYIDRVIFVAVPHRGSDIATSWIGWIGRKLMSVPSKVLSKAAYTLSQIKNLVRPDLQSTLGEDDFTSIKGLDPTNPALLALSRIAVASNIPCHSIIGDQDGSKPLLESSDGVVPYTSSHLEGCQSEYVVHSDHAAHLHPLAVQEIKRILYSHVQMRADIQ